eukprot:TRINITY_DN43431_c0_g1_i1.p1 TRINITY_DN43431_c0_g1~~TRINITY_DN43431_c0_g1_i1.p1  ORF type:complete len:146 (-),score=35.98 TRINITY_DN43431_c0_g1_i1:67-450(-)
MAQSKSSLGRLLLLIAGCTILAYFASSRCFVSAPRAQAVVQHRATSRTQMAAIQINTGVKESDLLQPDEEPERATYLFGFVEFAENFNGRIAMIFFFVLIFLEFFINKSLLQVMSEVTGSSWFANTL